jgi:hypothetical protein
MSIGRKVKNQTLTAKNNNDFAATAICGQNNANKKRPAFYSWFSQKKINLEIKNLELVDSYPLIILSQAKSSMQGFRSYRYY